MSKIISAKISDKTDNMLAMISSELKVSKGWVVNQALDYYLERYDELLSGHVLATMKETIPHEKVLKEFGL
jgi:predicted transcriptional regulator